MPPPPSLAEWQRAVAEARRLPREELQRRLDRAHSREAMLRREVEAQFGRPPTSIEEMMRMESVLVALLSDQPGMPAVESFELAVRGLRQASSDVGGDGDGQSPTGAPALV